MENVGELFKRYLFIVIQAEGTIYDTQMELSPLFSDDEVNAIRKLADAAEDEYS